MLTERSPFATPKLMKKRLHQKKSSLSSSRWLAYATAGLATAAGSAATAEAEVHYSGRINVRLGGTQPQSTAVLPLAGDASVSFQRGATFAGEYDTFRVNVSGQPVGEIRRATSNSYLAAKLLRGQNVSSGNFVDFRAALISVSANGQFADKGVGFAAFNFDVGNGVQYGWVRIKTVVGGHQNKLLLVDYAWADQTRSAANETAAVTENGSLGLLALGATGLVAWRKRRFEK